MGGDDSRTIFWGSPDGARSIEITWIVPGAGTFGRERRVPRSQATHARVRQWGGTRAGDRVVPAAEAEELVHDLELYQAQEAVDGIERERRRDAWLQTLCSTCPHCQTPRAYAGLEQLQEGGWGRVALFGEPWAMSNVNVHVYQCAYCGSIELFRDGGPIEHPLAGNREIGGGV
ncbi:MAG TPA: hypothetical protein VE777_07115 [Gaiellales bacterium]|jgi:hypothetical protein|nr:hypothetical protein [Gaiellales bacterium]